MAGPSSSEVVCWIIGPLSFIFLSEKKLRKFFFFFLFYSSKISIINCIDEFTMTQCRSDDRSPYIFHSQYAFFPSLLLPSKCKIIRD